MHQVEIVAVESPSERKLFARLPSMLHGDEPNWVPPLMGEALKQLDPARGPYYTHGQVKLWIARRGGVPVGRISAHFSPRYDNHMGGKKGFFGFFACENSRETAAALFNAAETHLRASSRDEVEGPYCFTVYDELGVLVDGFDTMPAIMVSHNPSYYADLIENCGYRKSIDWLAYRGRRGEIDTHLSPRIIKLAEQIEAARQLKLRPVDMKDFESEAQLVKSVFESAWDKNWGHVPMSDTEFWAMADGLKQVIVPELSLIAEVDGQVVGMAVSIYDVNPIIKRIDGKLFPLGFLRLLHGIKKCKRFRLLLMGILPRHRGRGYEVALYVNIIRDAIKIGFDETECSLIVENNDAMIRSIENLNAELSKRLRLYSKPL
ncbi:MAG: hypothetical protein Aurels2KO_28550 [Aureliella sp.]